MKKRTRSNKANFATFEYNTLESKILLAGDIDVARNLVTNGDFEADDPAPFFSFADADDTAVQDVRIRNISTSFSNIAVVDSNAGQIDSIAQRFATESGDSYVVSFDLRGANSSDSNSVEVLFGGESLGVFEGTNRWQTVNIQVEASADNSLLEFRESATVSDGRGILIDNVAVVNVEEINVRNGSFENLIGDISDGATNEEIPSIFTIPNTASTPIGVITVTDATDGDNVLELDTSDSRVDRVFTNLRTEANSTYFVSFDLRSTNLASADLEANTNLRLRFDGDFVGSFTATPDWQRVGAIV